MSTHEVKGEWISDIRPAEQECFFDETMPNTTIIKTRVWGKVREIANKVDIDVRLLKDTLKEAETDVFVNEQEFYLYFSSPVSGYLVVYLLDTEEDMAYFYVYKTEDKNIVLLTNITPEGILDEGHRAELSTYKGVMISKSNPEKDMFKINLLNMLQK